MLGRTAGGVFIKIPWHYAHRMFAPVTDQFEISL